MTMNEKNIFQGLKELRLSEHARTTMRSELSSYADLHTMPSIERVPFNSMAFIGSMFSHSRTLAGGMIAVVLIVSTGGATAFASESAVPGDVLYPVKIHVAEPVASVFAGNGAAGARYHAKLAVRRVVEADTLEKRGALSGSTEQELLERFSKEAEKAEREADRLASIGDYGSSIAIREELSTELSAYLPEEATEAALIEEPVAAKMAAPTMMMKAAATLDTREEKVEKKDFRSMVAKRVARLRENDVSAVAVYELDEEGGDSEDDKPARPASRALLSGASVSSLLDASSASSTASTTPESGRSLLREVIRATREAKNDETREIDTELILPDSVRHPERLVPAHTLIGE